MSEMQDAVNKAYEKKRAEEQGKALDPKRYASVPYDKSIENKLFSMPVIATYKTTLQNPDGSFKWMAGIDSFGDAPIGG